MPQNRVTVRKIREILRLAWSRIRPDKPLPIGNPTLADTILDRLVHNAYKVELKGESMRKMAQKTARNSAN